jgi:hypothetical protein
LVDSDCKVSGVIDFGDSVCRYVVNFHWQFRSSY